MKQNEEEQKEFKRALFRYGLIAPLLEKKSDKNSEYGQKSKIIHQITSSIHSIPYSFKNKICRATLYNYIKKFLLNGFEALKRKSRSDLRKSRKIKDEVLQKAVELKKENPSRSTAKIVRLLDDFGIEKVNYNNLNRSFVIMGLNRKDTTSGDSKPTRHFIREFANDMWVSDVKYSLWLYNRVKKEMMQTRLIVFLDKASRIVPHGEFYWRDNLPALENCFVKALIKRGIPNEVYMDNQNIYRSEYFRAVCMELGCRVIYTQPYSPQSKGAIEAFIGFVESDFLSEARIAGIQTIEELNYFFTAWLEQEYHDKIHTALGETPLSRFRKDIERIQTVDIETLHEKFLFKKERKVTNTCLVKMFGKKYLVDEQLHDKKVEVRFDYFAQDEINIWYDGKFIQKAKEWTPGKWTGLRKKPEKKETKAEMIQSARSYLENLAEIYQKSLEEENKHLLNYEDKSRENKIVKVKDFIVYLAKALGMERFSSVEEEKIEECFNKYGPFDNDLVKAGLLCGFSGKGKDAHISYYLKKIVEYQKKKGESR